MKKPKLNKLIPKKFKKRKPLGELLEEAPDPRITNETVAEHRDEVLTSARKFIYPLQHSKHKIVLISSALFIVAAIAFFVYTTVALYSLKSNSSFLYGVTKVIPFPVAKVGSRFVSYENYLFELRHYVHYYENQQKLDFTNDEADRQQLADYKRRALQKVIDDAYVKQLAKENSISISDRELNDQIDLVRSQNRLGSNDKGFADVLSDNFGWTINDFRRSLRQEMLAQKLVAKLDTEATTKAQNALNELKNGTKFEEVAKKYSEDKNSSERGGEYGVLIDKTNRDLSAQVTQTLFALKTGEVSQIINTGYTLEIVKNIEKEGSKIRAAHIVFTLKDISFYLNPIKDQQRTRQFISL